MRKVLWARVALLGLSMPGQGHGRAKRDPSTTEERQRFVTIGQKLEQSPLDAGWRREREWASLWLIQVPDISVKICTAPLGEFMKKKYKDSPELVAQLTFSSGEFIIEHRDQAQDTNAQYVAAA